MRQTSSNVMIWFINMLVLCDRVGSCCNLCLTICIAGATGTEVKSGLTSKEVMISPGSSLLSCC